MYRLCLLPFVSHSSDSWLFLYPKFALPSEGIFCDIIHWCDPITRSVSVLLPSYSRNTDQFSSFDVPIKKDSNRDFDTSISMHIRAYIY